MLDAIFSWDAMWWVLMMLYVPSCIGLIVIVLLQKGKGTGFAGAFGAGAGPGADTVFGPRMSRTLPVRLTYAAATAFMVIAVVMSLIAGRVGKGIAPELVEDDGTVSTTGSNAGLLSTYGLGTNKVDAARADAPRTEAPAVVQEETTPAALEEGASMSPIVEVVEETAATAQEATEELTGHEGHNHGPGETDSH